MELRFIIATKAYAGQSVTHEHCLNALIEWRGATQTGQDIDLKHPWLHVRVVHYVEAVDLEAIHAIRWVFLQVTHDVGLDRNQRLDNQVLGLCHGH